MLPFVIANAVTQSRNPDHLYSTCLSRYYQFEKLSGAGNKNFLLNILTL